jgi:transketolase
MRRAHEVADRFEASGHRTAIASVHTLKPLDVKGIEEILMTFATVVVIEEAAPAGSLSMQVKEIAWNICAKTSIHAFTLKDAFLHCYGSHDELLDAHGLSVAEITRCILDA